MILEDWQVDDPVAAARLNEMQAAMVTRVLGDGVTILAERRGNTVLLRATAPPPRVTSWTAEITANDGDGEYTCKRVADPSWSGGTVTFGTDVETGITVYEANGIEAAYVVGQNVRVWVDGDLKYFWMPLPAGSATDDYKGVYSGAAARELNFDYVRAHA